MYKINVDSSKKLVSLVADGMFTLDEAKDCLKEYESKLKMINVNEYVFLVDARKQSTSTPEVGEVLTLALNKYLETPFKKRYYVKLDSVIAMSQLKRLGGTEFINKFQIVDTPEEVINSL
ncbi:hypothetical protein [Vallitalea sp.]|jgi:hypothetical protein|uniref:hypothetical protein n=1 Tax=Vallitalea sp. TaxID=1882829 RepID=UPI0025D17380|nr:hypothetical protein [Vallitalea sp.]MCT4687517.1 hypothetical protein [Vallitalea sp.]